MSGFNDMFKLMQRQTDSLSEVPGAMAELRRAVTGAADTLAESKETVSLAKDTVVGAKQTVDNAKVTVDGARRSISRIEAVLDQLEGPVLELRGNLERLNAVLSSPEIERLPHTLKLVQDAVVPIAESMQEPPSRWVRFAARVAGVGRRTDQAG